MKEKSITKIKLLPDGSVVQIMPDGSSKALKGKTDWKAVKALTEEEINANALSDPDNPLLTDEELKHFKPVLDFKLTGLH